MFCDNSDRHRILATLDDMAVAEGRMVGRGETPIGRFPVVYVPHCANLLLFLRFDVSGFPKL